VVDGYIDIITNLKSRWRNVENWLKIWWMKEHKIVEQFWAFWLNKN